MERAPDPDPNAPVFPEARGRSSPAWKNGRELGPGLAPGLFRDLTPRRTRDAQHNHAFLAIRRERWPCPDRRPHIERNPQVRSATVRACAIARGLFASARASRRVRCNLNRQRKRRLGIETGRTPQPCVVGSIRSKTCVQRMRRHVLAPLEECTASSILM